MFYFIQYLVNLCFLIKDLKKWNALSTRPTAVYWNIRTLSWRSVTPCVFRSAPGTGCLTTFNLRSANVTDRHYVSGWGKVSWYGWRNVFWTLYSNVFWTVDERLVDTVGATFSKRCTATATSQPLANVGLTFRCWLGIRLQSHYLSHKSMFNLTSKSNVCLQV